MEYIKISLRFNRTKFQTRDSATNCTLATADRNSCCALSRKVTEPTLAVDLGKIYEINTVRILLPTEISFSRLQVRLGVSQNIHKTTICEEKFGLIEETTRWTEFACKNKIAAQWVIITVLVIDLTSLNKSDVDTVCSWGDERPPAHK